MIKLLKMGIQISCFCLICGQLQAQENALTIEDAYKLARQNYPMIRQRDLIAKTLDYSVSNAAKGYLPQINVIGQATYQSAVTEFKLPVSIPGAEFPNISKDQYKVYADVSQTIYDGGLVRTQVKSHEMNAEIDEQKLEVELYKVNERVNQIFFGVLMIDEQMKQNQLLKKDIQLGITKIQALIANGTAFKSNASSLKAELLKANQREIDLKASRKAYVGMLALMVNQPLSDSVVFQKPQPVTIPAEIRRPELKLYDFQNQGLNVQDQLVSIRNRPKFNFFFQGGFGRPALNILSNNFDPYYLTGLRLNWSLSNLYTAKNDRALIKNSRDAIQLQKDTFLYNTSLTLKQQNAETIRLQQLLATDNEIIALRESVKTTSAAQLENGIINTNDFLREVNAEDQARLSKILHEIQLLMSGYNLLNTMGKTIE